MKSFNVIDGDSEAPVEPPRDDGDNDDERAPMIPESGSSDSPAAPRGLSAAGLAPLELHGWCAVLGTAIAALVSPTWRSYHMPT